MELRLLGPNFHYQAGVSGVLLGKEETIYPFFLLNCPAGGRSTRPAGLNLPDHAKKLDLSPSLGPALLPPSCADRPTGTSAQTSRRQRGTVRRGREGWVAFGVGEAV